MQVEVVPQEIEIRIKLSPVELKFLKTSLSDLNNDDDVEDCDCNQQDCYECQTGWKVIHEFQRVVKDQYEKQTGQPVLQKKATARRSRA